MRLTAGFATLIVLSGSILGSIQAKESLRGMRVLVYTRNGQGYVHENRAASVECIRKLAMENGFTVDASDDPNVFQEGNLRQYGVIVFSNTNNDVFEKEAQKVAFMRFIQAGGGFVGIHSATGTERNWKWFKKMIGGTFERHPPYQKYKVKILDEQHPSIAGLPKIWEREDECYFVKEINPDIHVLMVHDLTTVQDKSKPDTFGDVFPAVWCHEYDGGREWYTALGHNPKDYSDSIFMRHILEGIRWAAGSGRKPDYRKAHTQNLSDEIK